MTEINVNLYESSPEIKVDITATGPQGPQGPKGEKGETGGVSTEELKKAIDSALEETLEDTVQVSTEERIPLWTPELAKVGQMLRVKQKNDDGSVILETVEIPSESVSDIRINGSTIVGNSKIAEIPIASQGTPGVLGIPGETYGLGKDSTNNIRLFGLTNEEIKKDFMQNH